MTLFRRKPLVGALIVTVAPSIIGVAVVGLYSLRLPIKGPVIPYYLASIVGCFCALLAVFNSRRRIGFKAIVAILILFGTLVQMVVIICILGFISISQNGFEGIH